ncbi:MULTISPECIES: phage protein NinX family protein [Citrobacter]|uniref:phage protein NinX family protein n=1 Tax=Citrobacter TaxID=544 RepID=UPI0009C72162|nr:MULTISPECIES: phage protein NinX family protein [Citrobacter]MDM2794096.1 DUF2591 domain-containing protein [Citrobacter sp. Cpo114]OPX52202.1 hypothetical protein B5P53_04630 [Citrobacter portucalensis]
MDYSKLSDHEINKMVSISLGKDVMPDDCQDFGISGFPEVMLRSGDIKNYCNEASDAWPIIKENMISVCAYKRANPGMKDVSWWEADNFCEHITRDDNPLRAAMIVFLMMQESANVPANSTGSDIR